MTTGDKETLVVAEIDYSLIELQRWYAKTFIHIISKFFSSSFWKYAGKAFLLTSKSGEIFTSLLINMKIEEQTP